MKIYHYDTLGMYIGETEAELDPLDMLPLVPSNSTLSAPSVPPAGFVAAFGYGAWTHKPDNSGAWYLADGSSHDNAHPLNTRPVNSTRAAPPNTTSTLVAGAWVADAAKVKEETNKAILAQIASIESTITQRTWRESVTKPNAAHPQSGRTAAQQIAYVDEQCSALRLTLVP